MNNHIGISIYYYEVVLVVLTLIAYFVIDTLEKKRKEPFSRLIHLSPLVFIAGIVLARILYAIFPQLASSFNSFYIAIYYYALIIISGVIMAAVLASIEARRRKLDPDFVWDMLPWVLIAGVVGARLWHVLTPSESILIDGQNPYFIRPLEIFNFRKGGLGIPGGIIGGALALLVYAHKKKVNFLTWADIAIPGVALAQGIGRWGNFFNQELYGKSTTITTFPISVKIGESYYLATFFYEFVWNLLNMCLLLWLPRKYGNKMKPGDNFLVYMIVYSIGRFALEFIRYEYSPVFGMNINQLVMGIVGVVATGILIWRHKKKDTTENPADEMSTKEN